MALISDKQGITLEMAIRMNVDLCFNHTDATRILVFAKAVSPYWKIRKNKSRSSSFPYGCRLARRMAMMSAWLIGMRNRQFQPCPA